MNSIGLDIDLNQFKRLKVIDRDEIIYKNLVYIRKNFKEYKLNKKIQYVWLGLLTLFTGFKKFFGG